MGTSKMRLITIAFLNSLLKKGSFDFSSCFALFPAKVIVCERGPAVNCSIWSQNILGFCRKIIEGFPTRFHDFVFLVQAAVSITLNFIYVSLISLQIRRV